GREFMYTQSTMSDGTYKFTVPYSTEGPIEGSTQFDTMPVGPYKLTIDGVTKDVHVSEDAILNGEVIEV
ncbi:MAG: hypothetical protein KKI07_03670, partial [Euryarchaeota archaeon]|nr:hypothetical protein [Euryarchaeota archaeon]